MGRKEITHNDLIFEVQKWPYPEAREMTYSQLEKWYDEEGYKGKTFLFKRIEENAEAEQAYNMGYALAFGFGGYVFGLMVIGLIFLWFFIKILKIFS